MSDINYKKSESKTSSKFIQTGEKKFYLYKLFPFLKERVIRRLNA
jgi:hypothetical protein